VVDVSALPGPRARWSRAHQLSLTGHDAVGPAVAVEAGGDAAVAWSSGAEGGTIEIAGWARGRGWRGPRRLSPVGVIAGSPDLAVGRDGRTVVIWRAVHGNRVAIQLVSGNARSGHWGRVETVEAGRAGVDLGAPRVGVDARGDALAVWYHQSP